MYNRMDRATQLSTHQVMIFAVRVEDTREAQGDTSRRYHAQTRVSVRYVHIYAYI